MKRNAIAIGIVTGIVCLCITFVRCPAQAQDMPTKTLVAPIFFFDGSYETYVSMTEASGRSVLVTAKRYSATGDVPSHGAGEVQVEENSVGYVEYEPTNYLPVINNGWVRLTYPANRQLHAVAHLGLYPDSRKVFGTQVRAVEPAVAFRFVARQVGHAETGIAIINPTEETQNVTVRFYPMPSGHRHLPILEQTWTVEPGHRLGKFLTELVPWNQIPPVNEVVPADQHRHGRFISGVARVIGQTSIVVGALDFYRRTGRFVSVPVSAEPPARTSF